MPVSGGCVLELGSVFALTVFDSVLSGVGMRWGGFGRRIGRVAPVGGARGGGMVRPCCTGETGRVI